MPSPPVKSLALLKKTKNAFGKTTLKISATKVFFFIIAFLCGRATLFSYLRPFGGAFFAALYSSKYGYVYILSALLGQLSAGARLNESGKYLFAMTVFALIVDKLPEKTTRRSSIRGGIFAFSLALSASSFMFARFPSVTLFDFLLLSVECAVAFCAASAFHMAIPIIERRKLSYSFSTGEEMSLVSLLGCALWGFKEISQIGIINISDILCILIIITFSVRLGSGKGVIAGLTMGLVSALGSGEVEISCVSYAFSALASSLAGSLGAIPACSAFIFANALITALANGSTEALINIYDIFIACIIYSFIPEKFLLRLTSFGSRDEKARIASDERCYSEYVLTSTTNTITTLLKRMELLEEKRKRKSEAEIHFYERIARRACTGCGMKRHCWSRDGMKTTAYLRNALISYMDSGKLNPTLLPENCLRPQDLRDAFVQMSEIYRTDLIWQSRLKELKSASAKQMRAFIEVLNAAEATLCAGGNFDYVLADDINRRLDREKIKCNSIIVMRDKDFSPIVMLSLENCGGFRLCEKGVCELISTACGVKMVRAGRLNCKSCNIKYVPAPPGTIHFATSKKSRDRKKVSGDSVLYRVINKSLYAAVLCDGMGHGEKAAFEAHGAAESLLDLIEAGVSGETAMEIVNSLLIPSGEVTFSAADLCLFDTKEKKAKIIKSGAAATFTKSGDKVDAIYSTTMPLGSVVKNEVETFTLSTEEGDMIIMISDGVLESSAQGALKDGWLMREIESYQGDDPSDLCERIVSKAMEKCDSSPRDDITVLTALIQ